MFNSKAAANPLTSNPGITSEIVKRNKGYAAQWTPNDQVIQPSTPQLLI